jgi:UDP-N-acetyl-2-amino-2-deoxyglucuronate dehydrogenase
MKMWRFAIIGAGNIGGIHALAIDHLPNAKLVVCSDLNEEKARVLATPYQAEWTTDWRAALAREDVDIACVCTPSGAHLDVAVEAASHGKHVLVEKPIEVTLERADAIIAACQDHGVKLGCIFPSRTRQGVIEAKKAIDAGRLGRLTLCSAYVKWYRPQSYYTSSNWRGTWQLDGGGALMNQSIHSIDLLQYLAGPVKSVYARTGTFAHQMETEDTAVVALEFERGALGTIEGSTAVWP